MMKENEDMMKFLESIGAVEKIDGGFRLTEAANDIVPDMVKKHESHFNNDVFSLWMNGMLELTFDGEGDPMIDVSDCSRDIDLRIERLTEQEIVTLDMIVRQYDQAVDKGRKCGIIELWKMILIKK